MLTESIQKMRRVTIVTLFVAFICVAILVTAFTMSMKLRPLKRQVVYAPPPPTAAPTRAPTEAPTSDPPTAGPTASPTAAPTTPPPTFAPLGIVCPPDINITLGSSLSLEACGFPTASGGDVTNCGEAVAFYSDEAVGIVARSPSFNNANIVLESVIGTSYTSLALASDGVYYLASQEVDVSTLYNDSNGVTFYLNGTQGSVHWDADAYRFVVVENGGGQVYVHLNTTASAPLSWETFVFSDVSGQNPTLAIWPQAYVVGIAAATNNLCVLNRLEMLNTSLITDVNATGPAHFCATSITPALAGYPTSSVNRTSWTPLGTRSVSTVSAEVESAGTGSVGAVWMRHHDDELHDGANTPLFDWIDVEHWTNINWTTRDYISLRYAISVNDFDSSYADCPTPNECIPTPVPGVYLDAMRENIMPNLHFYSSPQGGRVTASYVSHANGRDVARVQWVEMQWQSPTNLLAARFILSQQDAITRNGADGVHRWLPTAHMDAYGTTVVAYRVSSNETGSMGVRASSRLLNDPVGSVGMRDEVVLVENSQWSTFTTLDSAVPRNFTYSGGVARMRITGNVIHRTFTGANNCNQTTCVQVIVEQ